MTSDNAYECRHHHRITPFYYYLWRADGTEKLQRIPAERRRQRSNSSSTTDVIPHYEIPSTQERGQCASTSAKPIDETHMPKKLTIATENMICRFSSTHLSKLQETITAVENNPNGFDLGQITDCLPKAYDSITSNDRKEEANCSSINDSESRFCSDYKAENMNQDTSDRNSEIFKNGRNVSKRKTNSNNNKMSHFVHVGDKHHDALHESRVLVLYTGGTIGMRCRDGVYSPEQHYLPSAIRELPPLNDVAYVDKHYADVKVKPYCLPPVRGVKKRVVYWLVEYEPLLDSSDMTFDDWIRIARDIEKSYSVYDGFVILHGTDTLSYTACALSFMMENLGKPVVLTGAQIPVAEVRSDGRENMIGALIVAGSLDIPEVCVLFNNKLMRGCRVTKMDNSGLDAFHSPNMAPLATLDISINVNYESIFRSPDVASFHVHGNLCRNVVVLRIFPSMPIESVIASLKPPTQGVVLQTFGSGNMPSRRTDIVNEIASAIQRGCLVLNVTQCFKGHVEVTYASGKILADAGVIAGSDLTTEAALAKLAYVLSKSEWDFQMKSRMLSQNLRGELTVMHSEHIDEIDLIPRLAKFLCITSSLEIRLLRNALFPPLVCNAAHANDVELLEQLRRNGANIASADYNLRTALHVAASAGSADAVDYLLRHGVSVHARNSSDHNALMCAVWSKNLRVVRAIRKAGGQLVVSPARIGVELCLAADLSDIQSLSAWREAGADFSTPDYDGRTALHVACNRGLLHVVEFLCANGAKISVRDRSGLTPIDECRKTMNTLHHSILSSSMLGFNVNDDDDAEATISDEINTVNNINESDEEKSDEFCLLHESHDITRAYKLIPHDTEIAKSSSFNAQGVTPDSMCVNEMRRMYKRLQHIVALLRRYEKNESATFNRLTTSNDSITK